MYSAKANMCVGVGCARCKLCLCEAINTCLQIWYLTAAQAKPKQHRCWLVPGSPAEGLSEAALLLVETHTHQINTEILRDGNADAQAAVTLIHLNSCSTSTFLLTCLQLYTLCIPSCTCLCFCCLMGREPPLNRGSDKFFFLPTFLLAIWQGLLTCSQLSYFREQLGFSRGTAVVSQG